MTGQIEIAGPEHRSLIGRLAREPMFHFAIIGLALFLIFAARNDAAPEDTSRDIIVTPAQVAGLAAAFEATWKRPPADSELDGMVEDFVREEVYYREAVALGLDRNDTVIRRRLRQKMEFLTESGAETIDVSEDALRAHLDANPERFTAAPRIVFEQVFLGENPADAEVEDTLEALQGGASPKTLGRTTLLPLSVRPSTQQSIDGTFGGGFFAAVEGLDVDRWQGPVTSGYGQHLVRLTGADRPETPALEEVRERVEADWRHDQAERMREDQYKLLADRYTVNMPGQPQGEGG
jgi:hypothetical protein